MDAGLLALLLALAGASRLPDPGDPLADCGRFPDGAACQELEDFARGHLAWLDARRPLCLTESDEATWRQARTEAQWCFNCWDWAGAAQGNEGDRTTTDGRVAGYRRFSLDKLRELLGDDDYFAGRMPPPVPLWRFRVLD